MRELTSVEHGQVSGGWDNYYRWEDQIPNNDFADSFYVPFDIYIDTNHDGVADGMFEADQILTGTDLNNNEVPDYIDEFAMNYPPGGGD